MNQGTLSKFLEKRTIIYLKTGRIYTGKVIGVNEDSVEIIDKFKRNVTISNDTISNIESFDGGEENELDKRSK